MSSHAHAHRRLVRIVKQLASEKAVRRELAKIKSQAKAWKSRPDFLWRLLIGSFATMGNSRAAHRVDYDALGFEKLARESASRRRSTIERTFSKAGVRFYARKTSWLAENFIRISRMGGAMQASKALLELPNRDSKIQFLEGLKGIGPKYARNIMMDMYDRHFRESIAIDSRIKKVSETLDISFHSYHEHEQFYVGIARDAGLENAWELDRLLFNFNDEVIRKLQPNRSE